MSSLVKQTALAVGNASCPNGGVRIESGLDNGDGGGTAGNTLLEAGEVDASTVFWNGLTGSAGATGPAGTAGRNASISGSTLWSMGPARGGGTRLDVGVDNGDGEGLLGMGFRAGRGRLDSLRLQRPQWKQHQRGACRASGRSGTEWDERHERHERDERGERGAQGHPAREWEMLLAERGLAD